MIQYKHARSYIILIQICILKLFEKKFDIINIK